MASSLTNSDRLEYEISEGLYQYNQYLVRYQTLYNAWACLYIDKHSVILVWERD